MVAAAEEGPPYQTTTSTTCKVASTPEIHLSSSAVLLRGTFLKRFGIVGKARRTLTSGKITIAEMTVMTELRAIEQKTGMKCLHSER